jgi:hypothetical protein
MFIFKILDTTRRTDDHNTSNFNDRNDTTDF